MDDPVLHVIVVGFHHKKGCQVEFSYPPLIEGNTVESHEIPEEWKHIPSLALPDGAHNYLKDTVYFVLPGRKDNLHTVYGVSCYRQMDAKDLIKRTADVTRSTVQKSVCVLSRLPLFGLIKAKLELITHAYFDERDFSQVALLEQTYNNLNSSLTQSLLEGTQVFLGLSARQLVSQYKHKIIILFKLLMLERRVLFFGSPVEALCQTLLGLLSLFPGMLENGLMQACNQWSEKKLSPTLAVASFNSDQDEDEQFLEVRYHDSTPESPLSEVMCHMHNSALNLGAAGDNENGSLGVKEGDTKGPMNVREEPESPSIPRDPLVFSVQSSDKEHSEQGHGPSHNKKRLSTNCDIANTVDNQKAQQATDEATHPQKPRSKSLSPNDSGRLTVHVSHKTKKQRSVDETKTRPQPENMNHQLEDSPLTHVEEITHIEPVQSGLSLLSGVKQGLSGTDDNGNSVSQEDSGQPQRLTLLSTKSRPPTEEMIEELDSPESISKIDKEDCFSWEQDRLELSIEDYLSVDDAPTKDDPAPMLSVSTGQDPALTGDSGRESVSSDSTTASAPHHDNNNAGVTSKTSGSEAGSPTSKVKKTKALKNRLSSAFSKVGSRSKSKEGKTKVKEDKHKGEVVLPQDKYGYPLAIFTKGSVCHPYLSLQYHDILTDVNTRSFVIGATNVLFKQRRQLIDVVVEVEDGKLDIRDRELQRQLGLTTADLRFAEYLVRTVTDEKPGLYLDGTEWEGSDEWIRAQFKHYINSLLATVVGDDLRLLDDFGSGFMAAWKTTHNFRYWYERDHQALKEIPQGHPFQGNLSMADVRVRFNHTLQNTERGRRINAAVMQTGKYVAQTGRAVGGAFSLAKSTVSGWFSSWRNNEKTPEDQDIHEKANSEKGDEESY